MIAIAESTPGPIAINCATFVGYTLAKTPGAIAATVAVCFPSFVIIFLISLFFDAFLALEYVYRAFQGIQVCVTFLILSAGLKMLKDIGRTPLSVILFCASLFAMTAVSLFSVNFSSVYFILLGAATGLTAYCISRIRGRKNTGIAKQNRKKRPHPNLYRQKQNPKTGRRIHDLPETFLVFLEIGAVSFGGGYGMIPLIREKVLETIG